MTGTNVEFTAADFEINPNPESFTRMLHTYGQRYESKNNLSKQRMGTLRTTNLNEKQHDFNMHTLLFKCVL